MKFYEHLLRLYAITPDLAAKDRAFPRVVREWLEAGVRTIQLRDKKVSPKELVPFGRYLRAITSEYGALLIINDHADLALETNADGCHFGREDMPVDRAREILGSSRIIGLSTHDREQVLASKKLDVDYIGVGPIFKSATKDVGREILGPEFAGWAAGEADVPVVAIGGITPDNVSQVAAAGCSNIAVISALAQSPRPAHTIRTFLTALSGAGPVKLK